MSTIDWVVLIGSLLFIVIYGTWKTRGSKNIKSYLLGNNDAKWWTVGLSVMATQASAITFLSTPGQAFHDGMGFLQFYFGLPIALIIICITFIPIYHKLKVYTAYEFLETRFDLKTRSLAAILFLVQRGLAAGITIYAPAIVLSSVLGWDLKLMNLIIGILVIIYTVSGGTKAVSVTQKQQMFVIMTGMFAAFFLIIDQLPENMGFSEAISLANINNKMEVLDFSFDMNNRYTFWSGITGGLFLALSYFGTDQSQVQRYLAAKSVKESQMGLIFNAIFKIPMQFFILLVGVMVFIFFQFNSSPIFFNTKEMDKIVQTSPFGDDLKEKQEQQQHLFEQKKELQFQYIEAKKQQNNQKVETLTQQIQEQELAAKQIRTEAKEIIKAANPNIETNDKDYVFIYFILNYLPKGLIGLLLAVIISAAMSSTASELNALAATTVVDIYKRNLKQEKDEYHFVKASKFFTLMWGFIAILFACFGSLFENLIQFVNIIGSIFYGTILGIFLIAFYFKKIQAKATFIAGLISQTAIVIIFFLDLVSYLWLNVIACVIIIGVAHLLQVIFKDKK